MATITARFLDEYLDIYDMTSNRNIQLEFKFPMVKSKEELMRDYDEAIEQGPQENHHRSVRVHSISEKERELRLRRLRALLKALEGTNEKV